MVPFVELSDAEKKALEQDLRECNTLLAHYHEDYNSSNDQCKRNDFFKLFVSAYKQGQGMTVGGVEIPPSDAAKIMHIKSLEWSLMCAFSRLINKLAYKWSRRTSDNCLGPEDMQGEAFEAAIYSVIHFTEENRYSTFLHHCVNRHLAKVCNRTNGLSKLSSSAVKIKHEYQRLAKDEGATFDGVVQKMKLTQKQARTLRASLVSLKNSSSASGEEREFVVVDNTMNPEHHVGNASSIAEALANLELTDLERAVLEGFINSPTNSLGIGSLSKNLINPKTNKPYSRMSFTYAWQRVKKKIADAYSRAA